MYMVPMKGRRRGPGISDIGRADAKSATSKPKAAVAASVVEAAPVVAAAPEVVAAPGASLSSAMVVAKRMNEEMDDEEEHLRRRLTDGRKFKAIFMLVG